jgi:hypothetical protein
MAANVEIGDEDGETESPSYYIWQLFTVLHPSDANKDGAENEVCQLCDKTFGRCCCI